MKPGGGEDGSEEFRARAQADSGKEECDAEFAKREIGIGRHVPYLPADAADAAEDERHDERTTGQPETDRLRQHRGRRSAACRAAMPSTMPMKKGMKCVSFNSLSELPTRGRGFVEVFGAPDDLKLIAKLQAQTGHRGHLKIGAGHARHRYSEAIVEIEFVNGFA